MNRSLAWAFFAAGEVLACTPTIPGEDASDGALEASPVRASETEAPARTTETWRGTYTSRSRGIYVVDGGDWAAVKWRGDDASLGLGEGTMSLRINRASGEVRGTGDGALGEVVFSGVIAGHDIRMSVSRKDPLDRGLTGTSIAEVLDDEIRGAMSLSVADAHVIRQCTLTLRRADAP